MGGKLNPFLQPRERTLWLEPTDKRAWMNYLLVPAIIGFFSGGTPRHPDALTTFLNFFLMVLLLYWANARRSYENVETRVTDRRIVQYRNTSRDFKLTEVETREVAAVEVLAQALRITRLDGKVVVLEQISEAEEAGLALARAAGLPSPRLMARSERLAAEVVMISAISLCCLGYALSIRSALVEPLLFTGVIETLLGYGIVMLTAGGGFIVGVLLGLLALRPWFDRAQMRAWMWQSQLLGPKPAAPAKVGLFRGLCLWLVDFAFDPPASSNSQGEPHER